MQCHLPFMRVRKGEEEGESEVQEMGDRLQECRRSGHQGGSGGAGVFKIVIRFPAAKQDVNSEVLCEFVNVTRWKVAICGEYMKSSFKTCSHGRACNFIQCFRNPGGDYEWVDGDKPPPKYWLQRMAALFGHSDDSVYEGQKSQENFGQLKSSSKMSAAEADRYRSRRSRSREMDSTNHSSSGRRNDDEKYFRSNCQRSKSDHKGAEQK